MSIYAILRKLNEKNTSDRDPTKETRWQHVDVIHVRIDDLPLTSRVQKYACVSSI